MKTDFNIAKTMSVLLNPATVQKKASVKSAEDAVASLNAAAEILDNMGLFVFAEAATQVMERVPQSLNKNAQRYGLGALKYMVYLIEQTITDINALIPNASALSGKQKTNITSLARSLLKVTEAIKKRTGKLLSHLDSLDDTPGLELKYLIWEVVNNGNLTLKAAAKAFNNFMTVNQSVPEHVKELAKLVDVYKRDGTSAFVSALEQSKDQAEEETGKDFDAPGAEHKRFKEHEYNAEEPGEEEEEMIEYLDEYKNHP